MRKNIDLSDLERKEADRRKAELGLTDREAYLLGLGLPAPKRQMGRPRKDSVFFNESVEEKKEGEAC